MQPDTNGTWVRFEDVKRLLDQLQAARHDMETLMKALRVYAHCRHGQSECFCTQEARAELWVDQAGR